MKRQHPQGTQSMSKYVAISTPIGILRGRNAIYLDAATLSNNCSTLELSGEFNCHLASKPLTNTRWQRYRIAFHNVIALQMIELDTWESLPQGSEGESCFDECIDSAWLAQMGGKATAEHRHFVVWTYDDVFGVICKGYELTMLAARA